jgi:biopolymer transport protein ExbD
MKFARTTRLISGRPDAAPWLCLMVPIAVAAMFHEFLVLPRGLRIELPTADAPVVAAPGERFLIVAVDAGERLYFENQPITLPELQAALAQRAAQTNAPKTLLLQADRTVSYGRLGEVSGAAKAAGLRDVIFLTRPARP